MLNTKNDVEFFMEAGDQNETGLGKQSNLYMNLITEECIHELLREYDKNNIVGIADGIIDSIWVINGFIKTLPQLSKSQIWGNISVLDDGKMSQDELMAYVVNKYSILRLEYNSQIIHFDKLAYCLSLLIESLIRLGNALNIPLQEVWDEVARSNLSKIPESGKVIKNEFGKIQKPDTYFPPNIQKILEDAGLLTTLKG